LLGAWTADRASVDDRVKCLNEGAEWVSVWEAFQEFADVVLKAITNAWPPGEETPAGIKNLSADPPPGD
jgi:hypothetical protein